MAANKEEEIDLIVRVIDKDINIHVTRLRSTDVVRDSIAFQINAHLHRILGGPAAITVKASDIIGFEPAVESNTRFCDFTQEDKEITAYVLASLDTPSLMHQINKLLAEKENQQPAAKTFPLPPLLLAPKPTDDSMPSSIQALELKLAQVEVQRKKDMEDAQAQRKKDATEGRVLRQKDQENAAEETGKLKECIQELQGQIQGLERRASDQEAVGKQKEEAMTRYIESLAINIEATTEFLALGDEAGLDRIKRRNLLDRAQASLASSLGLVTNNYFPSISFREALGPLLSSEERQRRLSQILNESIGSIPPEAANLLNKPAALRLLAEKYSKVRLHGDQIAHGLCRRVWYEGSITRSAGADKVALMNLLDFVLPQYSVDIVP